MMNYTSVQEMSRQQEVAEAIGARRVGGLGGPYVPLLNSPEIADRVQVLGEYLRFNLRLPEPLRVLTVLVAAGRHRGADAALFIELPAVVGSGLAIEKQQALVAGVKPEAMTSDEELVYWYAYELSGVGRVKDATFDAVAARFGLEVCLEILAVCGFTAMQTILLNVTGTQELGGDA